MSAIPCSLVLGSISELRARRPRAVCTCHNLDWAKVSRKWETGVKLKNKPSISSPKCIYWSWMVLLHFGNIKVNLVIWSHGGSERNTFSLVTYQMAGHLQRLLFSTQTSKCSDWSWMVLLCFGNIKVDLVLWSYGGSERKTRFHLWPTTWPSSIEGFFSASRLKNEDSFPQFLPLWDFGSISILRVRHPRATWNSKNLD